jgi:glycerophosphoryl diester phosphodiesterase
VQVIAHRGFSGVAPENTLSAFMKAVEAGSDMIELDVRLSRDGKTIVFHDAILERTTDGAGKVSDYTLDELKRLDAGSWFSPAHHGERIPSLREVLELARGRVGVNIELKAGGLGRHRLIDLADRSLRDVEEAGMEEQVLFSSFGPAAIRRIREKKPGIPLALITASRWGLAGHLKPGGIFSALNCRRTILTPGVLSRARRSGLQVNVWTVDEEKEMNRFIAMGVDGIITNHPDRLIEILQERGAVVWKPVAED